MASSSWLGLVAAMLPTAPPASVERTPPVVLTLPASPAAPELTDETYRRWRDFIRPTPKELGFEEVPWRPTFWEAVVGGALQA